MAFFRDGVISVRVKRVLIKELEHKEIREDGLKVSVREWEEEVDIELNEGYHGFMVYQVPIPHCTQFEDLVYGWEPKDWIEQMQGLSGGVYPIVLPSRHNGEWEVTVEYVVRRTKGARWVLGFVDSEGIEYGYYEPNIVEEVGEKVVRFNVRNLTCHREFGDLLTWKYDGEGGNDEGEDGEGEG
ncbi:MAG: hypothetical protein N2381_10060, partial [Armatimonadetes bacterium]|nr:hypothetical protein [Armatimonadota bacterium]